MAWRWTDALRAPLDRILADDDWDRLEIGRPERSYAFASGAGPRPAGWYALGPGGVETQALTPRTDRRLREVGKEVTRWEEQGQEFELLAHRPGSRAIFRLVDAGQVRIVKFYRKVRHTEARWKTLPSDPAQPWSVPAVLSWCSERKLLVFEHRPGVSLHERLLSGGAQPEDADRVRALLEWLARQPAPATLPRHEVADEIRVLEERRLVFQRVVRDPPPLFESTHAEVIRALADRGTPPRVLAHRDFHDKQILLDGPRGTLIDLDLLARAPAQLDAGNILAHLRLRARKGADVPWQSMAARIAAPLRSGPDGEGLPLWTASTLMRLAMIYAWRRRSPALIEELLESTREALRGEGEWSGILS